MNKIFNKNWKLLKLWKVFIVIFAFNFLILNWNDVSWVFNYKFLWRGFLTFFENNESEAAENSLPTARIAQDLKNNFPEKNNEFSDIADIQAGLEIPAIKVYAPIIFAKGSTENDFQAALKKGVLYYPYSVLPGREGTTVILGHSAPPGWPKINYDWIFNDLYKLNSGDKILIYFNQKDYVFYVKEKFFLNKGEEIPFQKLNNLNPTVILLSCWPPGKDEKRIAVIAELRD